MTNANSSNGYVHITNTDNPNVKIVPNTIGAWAFSPHSLSGDGQRVVFSRNDNLGGGNGLYVAGVDGTEPATLIDNSSPGWSYGGTSAKGAAISDFVDKGVVYNSFDSVTGSGEIFTWGPSRVRYSNIERFDIIGTRYGDELRGGNLDDRLVGGGGADTLTGGLGKDTYGFNVANSAGSQIEDTGGDDVLELKNTVTDGSGIQKDENVEISLSNPSNGLIGIQRDGSNLMIDINKDGLITAKNDLSIINFFNATGTSAGNGFIETIQNLSGNDILNKLQANVSSSPGNQTPPVTPTTPLTNPVTPVSIIPGVSLDKNSLNFSSAVKGFGVKAQSQKPSSKVNEIVMLALDNATGSINGLTLNSPGYLAAAVGRAKTIFSTLGGDFFDSGIREISIDPSKSYQFIEIQDGSLSDLKQQIDKGITPANILYSSDSLSSPIKISENSTKNGYQVSVNNDELVLEILQLTSSTPSQPIGSNIQNIKATENRLIDLTTYKNQTLKVDLNTKSSAAYNNNIGFYAVEDEAGTIKLSDGTLLTTDKSNYAIEAIKQAVLSATKSDRKLDQVLAGDKIYAPVVVSQGTLDDFVTKNPTNAGGGDVIHAYFNYVGANPDKIDHFRLLGSNNFGVEDMYGGGDRDFNDLVINLNVKTV